VTQQAGYSGTPLPRKLGITEGDELALIGAPEGFEDSLGELPGVRLERRVEGGVVLEIPDGFDEQRVLDLARSSGDVTHFSRVRPSLAELFREVVSA